MALQRFIRRVGEAARGTGEAKGALQDLGIVLKNNDGTLRDVREILFDVAEGIKNTTSPAEQLRLAFKFFDSEGAALVNTLKDGRAGLEEFASQAQALGFVLDAQTVAATEEFNNQVNKVKKQVTGFVQYTLTAFLPVLQDIAEKFSGILKDAALENGGFKVLGREIAITLVDVLKEVVLTIAEVGNAIAKISKFGFGKPIADIAELDHTFYKLKLRLLSTKGDFDDLGGAGEDAVDRILPQIETFINSIGTVEENLGRTAVSAMKKFEDSIVNGIRQGKLSFKDFADFVVEQLLRIAVQEMIVKKISGFFGSAFSSFGDAISGRASGGQVTSGQPYIVGERGAELFVPNSSGQIVSNQNLKNMGASAPTVNFNISTVDASGFDELLASRKNLITSIINNAMNTKGKLGVV